MASFFPYQTDDDGNTLTDEDGEPLVCLLRRADSSVSFSRSGTTVGASFDNFEIPVYWTDNDLYLPLAVMDNLFYAGSTFHAVCLNGILFINSDYYPNSTVTDENGLTMMDYYYYNETTDRTEALVQLNYNLLCLNLDLNYGLKTEHGIGDSFDSFLETVGLQEQMLKSDGKSFHNALAELTKAYFADFHSGVKLASPYSGRDYSYYPTSLPASTSATNENDRRFAQARINAGLTDEEGNIKDNYLEVGDTAYITFDSFKFSDISHYDADFLKDPTPYIADDNIALIYYANSRINREDSPIRKVVLDLSNNGGGVSDCAIFVVSWMVGKCNLSITNPTTGAHYTVVYEADANLDGHITDADHLDTDKLELYCLTSASSFSCGNLVPALLKQSGMVTLIGQTTGGGACCIRPCITADGTVLNFSSCRQLCTVKNGSYYSIDQGVTPDFVIRKLEHFYDREWLTQYIATLP